MSPPIQPYGNTGPPLDGRASCREQNQEVIVNIMLLDSNAPQNIYDCDEFWLCDKKIEFSIPFWE